MTGRYGPRRRPRDAVVNFVYRLHADDGTVLYVGRSSDVPGRIRTHAKRGKPWMHEVRSVSMVGPFAWDEAVDIERFEIETHQPSGNVMYTVAHGWRSAGAA